jgi:hypothetical protein
VSKDLLIARSRIDVDTPQPRVTEPEKVPDQGHGSSRIAVGAGRTLGQTYKDLQLRAAYHDIMDREDGFVRGAETELFSLGVRHYNSSGLQVEQFTPVNILSLSPRDEFFQSPSWKVSGGWQRISTTSATVDNRPLAAFLNGGLGMAWDQSKSAALSYVFVDVGMRLSTSLKKGHALGSGISLGSYIDVHKAWRINPYVTEMKYFSGQVDKATEFGIRQRFSLSTDSALRVDISKCRELQQKHWNADVALLLYF